MAIYTYREQGRKNGITKPNIIICNSTHSAFDKACFYLDVELKRVPQDAAFKMDVNKTKRAIDKNTIMIVASAPNFSSGIVDDIEALS
jgi:sphinganine-1-phosphate aldolase